MVQLKITPNPLMGIKRGGGRQRETDTEEYKRVGTAPVKSDVRGYQANLV